jgi:hypothetical protein
MFIRTLRYHDINHEIKALKGKGGKGWLAMAFFERDDIVAAGKAKGKGKAGKDKGKIDEMHDPLWRVWLDDPQGKGKAGKDKGKDEMHDPLWRGWLDDPQGKGKAGKGKDKHGVPCKARPIEGKGKAGKDKGKSKAGKDKGKIDEAGRERRIQEEIDEIDRAMADAIEESVTGRPNGVHNRHEALPGTWARSRSR